MNLWEHQSSFNPNMPAHFFLHAGQLYDKYMNDKDIYRYGRTLKRLPKPKCVCFYNGEENQKAGMSLDEAVDAAIDDMPDDSLLKKFLLGHRAEVKGMYLTEAEILTIADSLGISPA